MKTFGTKIGALLLALAALSPAAPAAQERAAPEGGRCSTCPAPRARGFDARTVTTIQGRIVAIERVAGGRHEGVHLELEMGSQLVTVRLGPAFWVDEQPTRLAQGDEVEVKGSRVVAGGESVIVAQEVRRGTDVLSLRGADGVPLWRGRGMRWR